MKSYRVKEIEPLTKLNCIKGMGNRYMEAWIQLAEHYAPKLNEGSLIRRTAYTKHDFSHHCKDIYAIIDNVLLKNVEIRPEEYFVLAVAVLLHDISMTLEHFDRLCHSKQSADYVQKESSGVVWKEVPIQDVSIVKKIITAHSDIKKIDADGKEIISTYTLKTTPDKEKGELGEEIQVRWLAGVLRLADELDVTNSRIGNGDNRYEGLNLDNEDEKESYYYWEYLNYFKEVAKDRSTINIFLNEQYLSSKIIDDRENIVENIKNIYGKIENCLNMVNDYAFDNCEEYYNKIKIKCVKICDLNGLLTKEELHMINDLSYKHNELERMNGLLGQNTNGVVKNKGDQLEKFDKYIFGQPTYLDTELGEDISKYVYDNDLISSGHYRLNRRFCGVDWVDVRSILSDNDISTKIVQAVVRDVEKVLAEQKDRDILMIGISMNGNILASRTAFQLNFPFSYLIPTKPGTVATDMENTFKIGDYKKVVLFTGVISSFDTIANMIKKYMKDIEIIRIYTVLWRKIEIQYGLDDELEIIRKSIMDKVVFLNGDFPCEILSVKRCLCSKYGKCIAKNKQAYEEIYEWPLAVKDKKNSRVFINNILGCNLSCKYCYLNNIGLLKREKHTADEVIAEFERIHDVSPEKDIISIGCYAECMTEDNLINMVSLIKYFAEKNFFIQIATKKGIPYKWIQNLNDILKFENQLNVFVSLPTINQSSYWEPGADSIENRIETFKHIKFLKKIKFYIYIKPFLDNVTNEDTEEYKHLAQKYDLDIVVGNRFQFQSLEGNCINVGKNEMYEDEQSKIEDFINSLKGTNKIYRHSIEPIKEMLNGDKPQTI